MSERGSVCFHAGYLYPLFSGGAIPFTGGAEVQQALLARGLARRGFEVSIVTCDYGQPRRAVIEGLRFLSTYPPWGGVPVLRFFHPRLTSTVRALREADAEVYYVRGAGLPAGITWDVARLLRAGLVLGSAHDLDARARLALLSSPRDRWWHRRALRGADLVIAQTDFQRALYEREFGRASEVVANAVEIPPRAVDAGQAGAVVWLATYKPAKRPEWFLELARRHPARRFVMCGVLPVPPDPPAGWEAAEAAARACPNLEVRGFVDHARLGELFSSASLLVHTSPAEGFPNTLLEAWAHGLPAIAAVDPDGVITARGMGEVAADLEGFADAVGRWMADPDARRAAGARARDWVTGHHAPEVVLERFATLLDGVVERVRARRAR